MATLYWLGSGDHESGADAVRADIRAVGSEQQRAVTEIRESQQLTADIRDANQSAKREVEASRTINKSSAELINEGKSILEQIRKTSQ